MFSVFLGQAYLAPKHTTSAMDFQFGVSSMGDQHGAHSTLLAEGLTEKFLVTNHSFSLVPGGKHPSICCRLLMCEERA